MTVCFLNGRFFGSPDDPPVSQAMLSAFDAGLQHAVGLFETMLGGVRVEGVESANAHGEAEETWVLHLDEHLDRLAASARELGLSTDLRTTALAQAVLETVRRSRLPRARVRLTITGGDLAMLSAARSGDSRQRADPTILIVAQPATTYPDAMFRAGVRLTLADARANPLGPFDAHKTLNYWWRLRELQLAATKGAGEALVLSVTNHVCGGCVSNIFAIKGDTLLTPLARGEEGGAMPAPHSSSADPLASPAPAATRQRAAVPSPVLPGITRAWIIDRAERRGLKVERRLVSVQEIIDADEVFLTNSSWGVLPIVHVEKNAIANAAPGRWTLDLRDAWLALMPEAT